MKENLNGKSNYKPYISGLKGFACLMVMLGHYIGLYRFADVFPADSTLLDYFGKFIDSKIGFISDESYWVLLFFVVSGYLAANSKIPTLKAFLHKSFMRFLRLGVPMFFAMAIIFVIYKAIGFHTAETSVIFENSLIQESLLGEYSFTSVIFSPIKVLLMGQYLMNDPYWCLSQMFYTSIIIYFLLWLKEKAKSDNIFLLVFFSALIIGLVEFYVVYAGLVGMMVALLGKEENKTFLKNKFFALFTLAICAFMYSMPRRQLSCIFFGALIMLLPEIPLFNKIFSSKCAAFINKISFGIYSFHWPVFCSVGMLVLLSLYESVGLLKASAVVILLCVAITFLISIIYYYGIEKHCYRFLKKIDKWMTK